MNYLLGRRVYLGGPIEHGDPNHDWRTEVKLRLVNDFGSSTISA
jgi:hypothetical protein